MLGLMGKKLGMTTIFDQDGLAVPVTVIKLGDNIVTGKLDKELNGYSAVQVGGFQVKEKKLNSAQKGLFKKHELPPVQPLKEFRVEDLAPFNIGEPLKAEAITPAGCLVDIQGRSIGKGFQGTVKRYHAGRGPMSHGSKFHRSMGSIGAGTTPGRTFKGVIMPGRMGNETVTVRHLKVVSLDAQKNLLLVKGATPGVEGGLLVVSPSRSKWNSQDNKK